MSRRWQATLMAICLISVNVGAGVGAAQSNTPIQTTETKPPAEPTLSFTTQEQNSSPLPSLKNQTAPTERNRINPANINVTQDNDTSEITVLSNEPAPFETGGRINNTTEPVTGVLTDVPAQKYERGDVTIRINGTTYEPRITTAGRNVFYGTQVNFSGNPVNVAHQAQNKDFDPETRPTVTDSTVQISGCGFVPLPGCTSIQQIDFTVGGETPPAAVEIHSGGDSAAVGAALNQSMSEKRTLTYRTEVGWVETLSQRLFVTTATVNITDTYGRERTVTVTEQTLLTKVLLAPYTLITAILESPVIGVFEDVLSGISGFLNDLLGNPSSDMVTERTTYDFDGLPAEYERNVLDSDPSDPNSDIGLTNTTNESKDATTDGNTILRASPRNLPVKIYARLGVSPIKEDTDDDGLPDFYEGIKLAGTGASPVSEDADSDGVPDTEEDPDGDGLTNLEEFNASSNPTVAQSDGDSLADGAEVNKYGTNPNATDTDGDGVADDVEINTGTDPLDRDSDDDGIPDGEESVETTVEESNTGAAVSANVSGKAASELRINQTTDDALTSNPALASPMVNVSGVSDSDVSTATIEIPLNRSEAPSGSDLAVYRFDRNEGYTRLESTVDTSSGTVTAETEHFSQFAVFAVSTWNEIINASGSNFGESEQAFADIGFVIDSSGSMDRNDPSGYRKTAAKRFVDALLQKDRASVVGFDDGIVERTAVTGDRTIIDDAISGIGPYGGTNIAEGIGASVTELTEASNADKRGQAIILLTDGQNDAGFGGPSETSLDEQTREAARRAAANNITIYTIGLGDADTSLLQEVSSITNGSFETISSAEELPQVYSRVLSEETVENRTDSDNDGLLDVREEDGFHPLARPWKTITTNSSNPDTDGDGLPDGAEVGQAVRISVDGNATTVFQLRGHPNYTDADTDGYTDYIEVRTGTDALDADTDGDGVDDFFDPSPRGIAEPEDPPFDNRAEQVEAIKRGVVYGQIRFPGKWYSKTGAYLSGWLGGAVGADFIPVVGTAAGWAVDLRDLGANGYGLLTNPSVGNAVSVGIDVIGLVPAAGSSAKGAKIISKAGQTLRRVSPTRAIRASKTLIEAVPSKFKPNILRHFLSGDAKPIRDTVGPQVTAEVQKRMPDNLAVTDTTEAVTLEGGEIVSMYIAKGWEIEAVQRAGDAVPQLSKREVERTYEITHDTIDDALEMNAISKSQEMRIRAARVGQRGIGYTSKLVRKVRDNYVVTEVGAWTLRNGDEIGYAHTIAQHPVGPQYSDIPVEEVAAQIKGTQKACRRIRLAEASPDVEPKTEVRATVGSTTGVYTCSTPAKAWA